MMSNKETWNDGQLRSVQLIVNGFPENTDEPALPDELFLSNLSGERLVEEKQFESISGSKYLFAGEIVAHTEKALQVNQVSREDWLPKSQIVWFERAGGFTGEMPQRGLTDYE